MNESKSLMSTVPRDLIAGTIVFLVALPLCLGIALASGAPLFSGLIAGIVGGIVVGALSGSHTSVSGPAAGLTAIAAAQIAALGTFEAFLMAVVIGGVIQVIMGVVRAGALSAFFPSSIIKGLLAAIGIILIIKQTPYLLGHDMVPKESTHGHANILEQIARIFTGEIHWGAFVIGALSLALLITWDKIKALKQSLVPAPLVVVLLGVALSLLLKAIGGELALSDQARYMVTVPVSESISSFFGLVKLPDFTQLLNPGVYVAGVTIAIVASLETLLNLDAVDKLDTQQRLSPPNRELWAQGIGNITCGMLGGIPVTSVIIRGSVNVNAGSRTKLSAVFHGVLLLFCVMLVPAYLNMIPLSCLAAILLITGFKLASPKLFRQMWSEGVYQFLPFIITLVAIVTTDLLIGVVIGMVVSLLFILKSNLTQPVRQVIETHVGGQIHHIELANQVSFLNKAALERALRSVPSGADAILDARSSDYIDPDVLSFIREYKEITAPALDVRLSLRGFREHYNMADDVQFVDFTPRESQAQLTPAGALKILKEGNERFASGRGLDRNLQNLKIAEFSSLQPLAVVFSGVDARMPAELVFDLRLGELVSIRLAGNVIGPRVLGSMEYGCLVNGAKLIVIMGSTFSGLIKLTVEESTGRNRKVDASNLNSIVDEIQQSIESRELEVLKSGSPTDEQSILGTIAHRNVTRALQQVLEQSPSIKQLVDEKKVALIGAIYNSSTGRVEFLQDRAFGL